MAVALVDSSAIVAYMIGGDSLHADAVEAIEAALSGGSALAMSAITWSEVLHGALLGYYAEAELRELADDFGIAILPVDASVAERAAGLQAAYRATSKRQPRPRLRTPDALILATSLVHDDIDAIVCGDEKWTKVPGVSAGIVLLRERG